MKNKEEIIEAIERLKLDYASGIFDVYDITMRNIQMAIHVLSWVLKEDSGKILFGDNKNG